MAMDKKMMIGAGLGALFLLGVGGWVMISRVNQVENEEQKIDIETILIKDNQVASDNSEIDLSGVNGIIDLMKKGESMSCTFNYDQDEVRAKGEYYFVTDGNKMRMRTDSTIIREGLEIESHILDLADFSYTWTIENGVMTGYKFANDDGAENDEEMDDSDWEEEDVAEGENWIKETNLKCKKWKVDEKMFDLPKGVDFQDMSMYDDQLEAIFDENGEIFDEETMSDLE